MVRSSLALSMVTGKRFRIANVRADREKPGLMHEHLTCVQAAAEISGATVTGDKLGSIAITIEPGEVKPSDYHFRIGTGGGKFRTQPLTLNSPTHSAIIEKFLGLEPKIASQENRSQLVSIA